MFKLNSCKTSERAGCLCLPAQFENEAHGYPFFTEHTVAHDPKANVNIDSKRNKRIKHTAC